MSATSTCGAMARRTSTVIGAVVTLRARVGKDPWHAAVRVERHRERGAPQHVAGRARGPIPLDTDGNVPCACRVRPTGRFVQEKLLLGERHLRPVGPGRAGGGHGDERQTRLIDERGKDGIDRLARRGRHRRPEIRRRRVPVGVCRQVGIDPFTEDVGAHVALDHPQNSRTFLVGDRVERSLDLGRRLHAGADGPGDRSESRPRAA